MEESTGCAGKWLREIHPLHFEVKDSRWSGVEVVTCVSGGRYVKVMDFPVFHLFRASTPLPVHNVCENHEWDGMYMRLRFYRDFLEKHLASTAKADIKAATLYHQRWNGC